MALGKPWFCTFNIQVSGRWLWAILSGDKGSCWYDSFSDKMALKLLCISDTEKDCPAHSLLRPWKTGLWGILPGDRTSSRYNSFSGKMVLKKAFIADTGKPLYASSGLLADVVSSHWEEVHTKSLLRRCSSKGHTGKPLYIYSVSQETELIKSIQ